MKVKHVLKTSSSLVFQGVRAAVVRRVFSFSLVKFISVISNKS